MPPLDGYLRVGEFERTILELRTFIKDGFRGIHERQDIANGKLSKHDMRLARLEWRASLATGAGKAITHICTGVAGGFIVYLLRHWMGW